MTFSLLPAVASIVLCHVRDKLSSVCAAQSLLCTMHVVSRSEAGTEAFGAFGHM